MREVARKIALDVGSLNQMACVKARVVYVESGVDKAGLAKANRLGEMLMHEILALPSHISTPAVHLNEELQEEVRALRRGSAWHKVIGLPCTPRGRPCFRRGSKSRSKR